MKRLIPLIFLCLDWSWVATYAAAKQREALAFTHYAPESELFVEFKALAVGQESPFAAHLTSLADFSALTEGKVTVSLSGGGQPPETFESGPSANPGIFRPIVKPAHAGERRLTVTVESPRFKSMHDLGEVRVYPDLDAAPAAVEEPKKPGEIAFLKEQQWQIPFATAPAETRALRASFPATGVLRAPANAETTITAASPGIVVFPDKTPLVGHPVERGELLASIVPKLAEKGDMALLAEEAHKAQLRHDQAHREQDRTRMLVDSGVVAERQLLAAQTAHQLVHAEWDAAEKRLNQYRQPAGASASGIPLRAPISGVIAQSFAGNGRYVEGGEKLFQIVDRSRLWLEARVPESDSAIVAQVTAASFKVDGYEGNFEIKPGDNGRLISLSTVVDPVQRTLPIVFELDRPDPRLPLGAFARVRLYTGSAAETLAVPESALVDDNGVSVVFVQTGGESFERHPVKLGARDTGYVEIQEGLQAGDRVVTKGAYLVYLSSTAPGTAAHGHVH